MILDKRHLPILASLFIAAILSILPASYDVIHYWPDWMLLTTIYWCLAVPHQVNIRFAFLVGLFADLLYGSVIGQHALIYTISAYFACSFYQLMRFYPSYQQILPIMLVLLGGELISIWISGIRYSLAQIELQGLFAVISSGLAWPWTFAVLRGVRQRFYRSAA